MKKTKGKMRMYSVILVLLLYSWQRNIISQTPDTNCLVKIGGVCLRGGVPGSQDNSVGTDTTTTTTSTTTTTGGDSTTTTAGKPWPTIVPTSPTQPPPPPEPEPQESGGMSQADKEILKWLLANDPNKPLERIGLHTKLVNALLNPPRVKEAIESLKQKLQNLDSQDPEDPEVKKIVKEFRTILKNEIARAKIRSIKNRKGKLPEIARAITPGLAPDKPIPPPAKPMITNPPRPTHTQPPAPPSTEEEIPPPPPSSEPPTTSPPPTSPPNTSPPQPDPVLQALLQLLQQLLQKQQQSANEPQEIKDLRALLNNASSKCKEEVGKKPGGTSLMSEITTLLGKNQWTDQEKERAKQLKTEFCSLGSSIPDCSNVCSGDSPPPQEDPFKNCRAGTTCSCSNSFANKICKAYTPNNLRANKDCESSITEKKYLDPVWFHVLLDSIKNQTPEQQNSVLQSAYNDFVKAVCTTACKQTALPPQKDVCP